MVGLINTWPRQDVGLGVQYVGMTFPGIHGLVSLVPRPFLSLKKKNAKKSGGRVWANGLLLDPRRSTGISFSADN